MFRDFIYKKKFSKKTQDIIDCLVFDESIKKKLGRYAFASAIV